MAILLNLAEIIPWSSKYGKQKCPQLGFSPITDGWMKLGDNIDTGCDPCAVDQMAGTPRCFFPTGSQA